MPEIQANQDGVNSNVDYLLVATSKTQSDLAEMNESVRSLEGDLDRSETDLNNFNNRLYDPGSFMMGTEVTYPR